MTTEGMRQAGQSKKIAILYGSETGNAYDFATILSYKLHRLQFAHTFCSLGDYRSSDILNCRYLFIVCSTTGQGELPRNAREASHGDSKNTLWTFLKKKNLPKEFLSHVNTFFLGLGDSSYPKFNYAIRKLHERLINQLGANELFDRLEGDEQGMLGSNKDTGAGIEAVYFEYEKKVLKFLRNKYPNRKINGQYVKREAISDDSYLRPTSYLVLEDNGFSELGIHFDGDDSVKMGTVVKNKRITAEDHFQDVRQFVFHGKETESYFPGDTISIYCSNNDESVQQFLEIQPHWLDIADKALKFSHEMPVHLEDGGLVQPLTLRNILKYHCDINSIPRASFFMKIWTFATDLDRLDGGEEQLEQQREKLHQFATDEDMQDLFDYCNRPRRSILEVMQDFLSLKLPWEYALDYLPIIKPRFFSISSGPCDPNIELTIAIVKYKTILRKIRKGVCTDYITGLSEGDHLRYKVQNNNWFKYKLDGKPMILISPGVGIAPMMSLIRSNISPDMRLYFGNRYRNRDFLYESILQKWAKDNKISLYTCFSRDRENSPDVKYVQDVLWKMGQALTDSILNQNAVLFVCGSSGKMPIQVRLTFEEMLKKWGNFENDDEAKLYLKEMEKNDRYLQETW